MPKFLWVSASPSLNCFHRRLLNHLAKFVAIEFWEYYQTLDEGSSINSAISLLHEYLLNLDEPVHLIGHGIGGVVALGYARIYPDRVQSLALLSVPAQPAIDWHSYYYARLRSSPCTREQTLGSIASQLAPYNCAHRVRALVDRLAQDLVEAPSNNSLFRLDILAEGGVEMPLLVCGSQDDPIVTMPDLSAWSNYFKPMDIIWQSAIGGHFFHHFDSEPVSRQIQRFWQQLEPELLADRFVQICQANENN
jgi:pimeloyl-ACP methyl ester carboxylesterase